MGTKIDLKQHMFSLPVTAHTVERYSLQEGNACFVVQAFKRDEQLYNKAEVYFEDKGLRYKIYDFEVLGLRFFISHEVLEKMYRVTGKGTYENNYLLPIIALNSGGSSASSPDMDFEERNRYREERWDASVSSELSKISLLPSTKSDNPDKRLEKTAPSRSFMNGTKLLGIWKDVTEGMGGNSLPPPLMFLATINEDRWRNMEFGHYSGVPEKSLGRVPSDELSAILLYAGTFFDLEVAEKCSRWLQQLEVLKTVLNFNLWMKEQGVPGVILYLVNLRAGHENQVEFFRTYCSAYLAFYATANKTQPGNHSMDVLMRQLARASWNTITIRQASLKSNSHLKINLSYLYFSIGSAAETWTKG